MIRRWTEKFQLVERTSIQSDGVGGSADSTFRLIEDFRGHSLSIDEPVTAVNLGVSSIVRFDIITPIKLPSDWLKRQMEIHSDEARLRIIRQRDLKRIRQITVEVIDG